MATGNAPLVLYFAHPINIYNTPLEESAVQLIKRELPGVIVENPNQPQHARGYEEWKKRSEDQRTQRGMGYFFEVVLPACNGCSAMPFLDGKIGAGVAGEVAFYVERGEVVYCVELEKKSVRLFADRERRLIAGWAKMRLTAPSSEAWQETGNEIVLSISETRLRTWRVYNREKRPYEEAHLVSMPIPQGFYPGKS